MLETLLPWATQVSESTSPGTSAARLKTKEALMKSKLKGLGCKNTVLSSGIFVC